MENTFCTDIHFKPFDSNVHDIVVLCSILFFKHCLWITRLIINRIVLGIIVCRIDNRQIDKIAGGTRSMRYSPRVFCLP